MQLSARHEITFSVEEGTSEELRSNTKLATLDKDKVQSTHARLSVLSRAAENLAIARNGHGLSTVDVTVRRGIAEAVRQRCADGPY